jgi:hypothetical protein
MSTATAPARKPARSISAPAQRKAVPDWYPQGNGWFAVDNNIKCLYGKVESFVAFRIIVEIISLTVSGIGQPQWLKITQAELAEKVVCSEDMAFKALEYLQGKKLIESARSGKNGLKWRVCIENFPFAEKDKPEPREAKPKGPVSSSARISSSNPGRIKVGDLHLPVKTNSPDPVEVSVHEEESGPSVFIQMEEKVPPSSTELSAANSTPQTSQRVPPSSTEPKPAEDDDPVAQISYWMNKFCEFTKAGFQPDRRACQRLEKAMREQGKTLDDFEKVLVSLMKEGKKPPSVGWLIHVFEARLADA